MIRSGRSSPACGPKSKPATARLPRPGWFQGPATSFVWDRALSLRPRRCMSSRCRMEPLQWSYQPLKSRFGTSTSPWTSSKRQGRRFGCSSQSLAYSASPGGRCRGKSSQGRYSVHGFSPSASAQSCRASAGVCGGGSPRRRRRSGAMEVSHHLMRRPGRKAPGQSTSVSSRGMVQAHMAARCGGRRRASCHCIQASYEAPRVPTRPSHQGCAASHSTESYPSSASPVCSTVKGTQSPSEP